MSVTMTNRHEELLDQLVELFLAEGFRRFTLADLATRLHCSKTTLYALSNSKEQLVARTVVHFFRTATVLVEDRTARAKNPAERIVAYLSAVAEALRDASPQFMDDLAAHPVALAVYERNTRMAAARVRELIADGVQAEAFRAVHAAFVADTVAATMERIQTGRVREATGLLDAEAYDELAALVLTGIRL